MHVCCVRGCSNSSSSGAKVKFYRLPTSYRPFQAKRRSLWLQVLQNANGGTEEFHENARICGAHFLSGQVSMDPEDPDFVPTLFPTLENSRVKNNRRTYKGLRGKRCRNNEEQSDHQETSSETSREDGGPKAERPAPEKAQSPHSPEVETADCLMTEEMVTEETPNDSEMKEVPLSPPLEKTPLQELQTSKIKPVVILKQIVVVRAGAHLGDRSFKNGQEEPREPGEEAEEETPSAAVQVPSFPCNLCDRSFPDPHLLKRHKLLHVKDGRKCTTCGALFCRLHGHAPTAAVTRRRIQPPADSDYVPGEAAVIRPARAIECHQVQRVADTRHVLGEAAQACFTREYRHFPPDSDYVLEPGEVVERVEDFETSWNFIPMISSPISQTREGEVAEVVVAEVSTKSAPEPVVPPAVPEDSDKVSKTDECEALSRACQGGRQKLPPALRMFSSQYLTSTFLHVKRNHRYLFSKGVDVPAVKKEPEADVRPPPPVRKEQPRVKETTAFDLQIML
ncbi:uncharacterized protein LOC130912535 [Corythoichthys intestinalis]|uniref:uncharacterized protein LOC130912535 n=1 Tax=Corythoichthys intestinalis TaxID=161448 RepID=UPI0025A5087A|nr:uncharacterized protein LOC130912535 [Corythoichthys intestinalis]